MTAATARCSFRSASRRQPRARGAPSALAARAGRASGAPWLLVIDDEAHPLGWVEPHKVDGAVRRESLHRGGTVAAADGVAAPSPRRRPLLARRAGGHRRRRRRLLGTVLPHEVLCAIESDRAERPATRSADAAAAGDGPA